MNGGTIPRSEYPRPEARRGDWICLNGQWDFEFDAEHEGMKGRWFINHDFSRKIIVPFVYQSRLSGIDSQEFVDTVWYHKSFFIPDRYAGKRIFLHFGAVDYECDLFVNGIPVGTHQGGVTPFSFDITDFVTNGKEFEQHIVLRVVDHPFSREIPRGKQSVERQLRGIFYEKVTGIWQTAWLEFLPEIFITRSSIFIQGDPLTGEVIAIAATSNPERKGMIIEAQVYDGNDPKSEVYFCADLKWDGAGIIPAMQRIVLPVEPSSIAQWNPDNPKLYAVKFNLIDGDADDDGIVDTIDCTFGFRRVEVKGNKILLNNEPIYLKQALYQGYWPDGLWTSPSDEKIRRDLELTIEMGFNSLRIHQKVEDPRFLHHADEMGVLIWGEMANAFGTSLEAKQRFMNEWQDVMRRDRSHPSIIAWTPINESWGTGDLSLESNQSWLKSIYYLTKTLDPTRPVSENDGWEHVLTDIASIHDYSVPRDFSAHWPVSKPADIVKFYADMDWGRRKWAPGCTSRDEPIVITEWGGWSMDFDAVSGNSSMRGDSNAWGYQGTLYTEFEEILDLYEATIDLLVERKDWISGHCYTEFNDQYQEMNGLLTFDRRPKGDLSKIKQINDKL
ncbi:MAG: glycoside hydrolase family 2 protein [Promethearchaeota archaeon]